MTTHCKIGIYFSSKSKFLSFVEVNIDGGATGTHNLSHRFSRGLHYPRTVMFATDLNEGKHSMTLQLSTEPAGRVARALHFVAN